MPACSSEKVRKQCDTIVTTEELAQGTHFLQTTFEDRLSELPKQGLFTPEETASLIETNDRLLARWCSPPMPPCPKGCTLWRLPPMPIPLHPKQLPMLLRAKTTVPTMGSRKARPAAGRKDLLSPSAVFRDRFLPFRKRTGADAACAISERAIRNPQSGFPVPFPDYTAF